MILYIKGADFSSANIGTLNTYTVRKNIGQGAEYVIPNSVLKGATGIVWEIRLNDNYNYTSYSVSMGGADITTTSVVVNDNILTITLPSVTGNVVINIATEKEQTEVDSGSTTGTTTGTTTGATSVSFANTDFEIGGISSDGVSLVDIDSRWRQIEMKKFDSAVVLSPTTLAGTTAPTQLRVWTYSDAGTKESDTQWISTPITVDAHTNFKLSMSKADGTAVADKEYINVTVPAGATKLYVNTLISAKDYSYVTYNGQTYQGTEFVDKLYHYNNNGVYASLNGSSKMAGYPSAISVKEGDNVILSVFVSATLGYVFTNDEGAVIKDSTGVSMPQRAYQPLDFFTYNVQ